MDVAAFLAEASALGLEVRPEPFAAFEEALYARNALMNLTRVPREECFRRHFLDSLLLQDLLSYGAEVLDIGTGPGFPAWPLACARPDLRVLALDSSGKMLGFLREHPLPNLEVVQARAEEWGVRERFDVVTGRAVAPLPLQLELSAPAVRLGGAVVPMRTPAERPDLGSGAILGLELEAVHERPLAGTDAVRLFPVYRKMRATPIKYPRAWADMKRRPLEL